MKEQARIRVLRNSIKHRLQFRLLVCDFLIILVVKATTKTTLRPLHGNKTFLEVYRIYEVQSVRKTAHSGP